jgi:hypothetical protein
VVLYRYVYQKAYVEFFVSPAKLDALLTKLDQHPSITYMAVNKDGDVKSNMKQDCVNAVTWGVFPGGCASSRAHVGQAVTSICFVRVVVCCCVVNLSK